MTWTVTIPGEDGLRVESDPVARLRNGDIDSLTELIPIYQNRLYRYLVRLVSDPTVADDLFQETWLRVSNNIRRYDPNRSFDHWLFSIAHNLAIDHLRRWKPEALVEATAPDRNTFAAALDRLLDSERGAALSNAITELPAVYREVIALRFEEDMKLDEIARVTGAPLPTVKTRLQRALQNLRKRFQ
jgi:RNA polymerase sigma-70 factor (ECF subfamily)